MKHMRTYYALLGSLILAGLAGNSLNAQDTPALAPVKSEATNPSQITGEEPADPNEPDWNNDHLTGDWGGVRHQLWKDGVAFGVNEINEVLANPSGGIKQGVIDGGRLELALDLDFEKMAGLEGSSFHTNAYYIYGSDLSAGHIGNIFTVSNVEAYDTLRLFDLWYQQIFKYSEKGSVSVRVGQIAADDEFVVSQYGATFINGTFGWPALTSANLASGGPGYPLATPGIRVEVDPTDELAFLAAVFDGDPGDRGENPQKADSSGTKIDFNQGALTMFEAQYKLNQENGAKGLPGTYKLGGFYATQNYGDVREDGDGLSLADPATSGVPRNHSGDWGIYAVADQMVYRAPSDAKPAAKDPKDMKDAKNVADAAPSDKGLGVFVRMGGTPSNRNLIDFYTDGGVTYKGLFAGCDDDVLGLAVGYGHISNDVSGFDEDTNSFSGNTGPVHDEEIAIELTYQANVFRGCVIQPDVQYIIHPGGNVADPTVLSGTSPIPNAIVVGVRTTITF